MSEPLFKGVLPALVTPFRDGAVDEDAFVRLVQPVIPELRVTDQGLWDVGRQQFVRL